MGMKLWVSLAALAAAKRWAIKHETMPKIEIYRPEAVVAFIFEWLGRAATYPYRADLAPPISSSRF
jgi:hypothetical protein